MKKYESYTICPSLWNKEFPSHWCVLPMYAVAKEKSICNCVDLPLLSVYLDVGVVPFSAKAEKRTNAFYRGWTEEPNKRRKELSRRGTTAGQY